MSVRLSSREAGAPPPLEFMAQNHPLLTALALSLAAAIALGLSRFSYGLLMPPMRADLGWSYFLAGAMNSANALGYFIGALLTPKLMRFVGVWRLLVGGAILASVFMLLTGLAINNFLLFFLRICAGVASAFIFIAGGVLAARLASFHPKQAGFLIGLYYGGTGIGIVLSALLVPAILALARANHVQHTWQWPWLALAMACFLATALLAWPARTIGSSAPSTGKSQASRLKPLFFSLSGYFMFGVGYIGYMTFVVALLKAQGLQPDLITWFYALLGMAVIVSSRIWAPMLERFRGGESLAILNIILGVATILPALTSSLFMIFISGIVFGGVFLSVVAATTILVRHNLPPDAWASGITTFTVIFAFGQIIGPTFIGLISDGPGGLARGLIVSAIALFIGAVLALKQKSLA